MFSYRKTFLVTSVFVLGACAKGLPMMGLDEKGKPIEMKVDPDRYSLHLESMLDNLDGPAANILEARSRSNKSKWKLTNVIVGIGVVAEAGIGAIKVTAEPRFRFVLSNSDKPTIP